MLQFRTLCDGGSRLLGDAGSHHPKSPQVPLDPDEVLSPPLPLPRHETPEGRCVRAPAPTQPLTQPHPPTPEKGAVTRVVCPLGPPAYAASSTATRVMPSVPLQPRSQATVGRHPAESSTTCANAMKECGRPPVECKA